MGLKIHQYPIERTSLGADDFIDIDYYDGSQYRTAKIKAENAAAVEKLTNVDQAPLDLSTNQGKVLVKGDDGLWRLADASTFFDTWMQSGLKQTTPNVTAHNFDGFVASTDGSWQYTNLNGIPYIVGDNYTFGEPIRMADMGNFVMYLYASPSSNFIEVDNVIMQGITTKVFINGVQYTFRALNLIECSYIQYSSNLTNVDAPNLKRVGRIYNSYNTSIIDFPSLEIVNNIGLWSSPSVFNLPNLKYADSMDIYGWPNTPLTFLSLLVIGQIQLQNTQATELNLPNLEAVGNGFYIQNNYQLTSINITSLVYSGANYITFQNNALNQASVDAILVQFANMDGVTNGISFALRSASIFLNGGTNQPPSAVGLAAISVLQSRGCGVATN